MFQTNPIMVQEKIDFLKNTKEDWLVLLERKLCNIMDKQRPKTGNYLPMFSHDYNIMSLDLHLLIVLAQRFYLNTKTFNIPSNVDADATFPFVGLNKNYQEPGEIIKKCRCN